MGRLLFLAWAACAALSSSPAYAQAEAAVPEGSHLTLFALGVLGVIIGRSAASKRRD